MARRRGPGIFVALAALLCAAPGGLPAPAPDAPQTVSSAAQSCEGEPLSKTGEIYYVCDCQPGAAAGCQPGRDENHGRSAASPWRTLGKAQAQFPALRAGDTLAFCRGGVFAGGSDPWFNTRCRANQPCHVRDYRPPWGAAGDPAPKLHAHLNISNGGNAQHKEGVHVSNLSFEGDGTGVGIVLNNDATDMQVCNVTVQNYEIGVYVAGANLPEPGSEGIDARVVLRGSRVLNNKTMGWLGSCDGCRIEYNLFDHNGGANMLDHSIYINDANVRRFPDYRVHGMQVLGNEIRHSAQGSGTVCEGAPIVVHGNQDDLLIRGNDISQELGTAGGGCWGIMASANYRKAEGFHHIVVSGNTITNVGNASISLSECQQCVVENNLIIQAQPGFGGRGVLVNRNGDRLPQYLVQTAATVLNNTIFFSTKQPSQGVIVGSEGRDHAIAGNVVVQTGPGGLDCFAYDLPRSAYYSDHNVCWNPDRKQTRWETRAPTLGAWRAASGLDAHSTYEDPLFVRMGWKQPDFSPTNRSPLIHAGDPQHHPATDHAGRPRPVPPDAGALEHQ